LIILSIFCENNPLTKLSSNYGSKIIEKIQHRFKAEDQQLFVANFYCYLNYNQKNDFVINLDRIWKWLGYSRISFCKTMLIKNFTQDIDFRIENFASEDAEAKTEPIKEPKETRGGHNKEYITLTVNCFKKLCLKSKTEKADQIHDYYVGLEDLMNELVSEQTEELRQKLQLKDVEKQDLLESTLLSQFPQNEQCIYIGLIDDLSTKQEKLIKIGYSFDLSRRVKEHKNTYTNFKLIKVFKVLNPINIENCVKKHNILEKKRRSIIINEHNYIELFAHIELGLEKIYTIIEDIIKENEYNMENYTKILKINEEYSIEINKLKNENKQLIIENKQLLDKLIKYAPTSISEVMTSQETKLLNKNMTTNISSNGFYLYAFKCSELRYKIGICKVDGIQDKELIYKMANPSGLIEHKVLVKNNFINEIMIYLAKKNLQILDKDTYECSIQELSEILNTSMKMDELFVNNCKNVSELYEKIDRMLDKTEEINKDPEEPINKKSKRPVEMIDTVTGKIINSFPSLEAAGKFIGVTGTAVGIALRNKKLCKSYLFRYTGITTDDQYKDQPVIKINCNTGEQINFGNIATAAKDAGISAPGMRNRINTNVHLNNFHWVWNKSTHFN
jgi:hypothetical protein